jgi:hypothetical protein
VSIARVHGIPQCRLPEAAIVGRDVEVALLRREGSHVGSLVAAAMSRRPERIACDLIGAIRLEQVAAQHGDTRSEVAQWDREVDDLALAVKHRAASSDVEDAAVGELHLLGGIVPPGGHEQRS